MAPITKVLGTKNGADLMTKNVPAPLMLEHCRRLGVESRAGRSSKAAALQSCSRDDRLSRADEKMIAACEKYSIGNGQDYWRSRGAGGNWIRVHSTPRRSLFTPCRVPRGPSRPDILHAKRVTEGINTMGEKFRIEDGWREDGSAHRVLAQPWTGITIFVCE